MEQANVYNLINFNQSTFNTANIPPAPGMHSGTNSAYSIAINSFLCPSSPGPATINYYNANWGPYGNGGGDTCTPGGSSGGSGASNLNPPPTQVWGRTDYFPIPGISQVPLLAAGMNPAYAASRGQPRHRHREHPGDQLRDPRRPRHRRHRSGWRRSSTARRTP